MHSAEKQRPHGIEAYAVNRIGHTAGRKLAAGLWKQQWIQRLASKNPELMRIVSEGAIALTSMLEMGGDSTLARLVNFIAESLSMENLELLEKFEKDPENPELAAQVEKIGQDAGAKADTSVIVALEHVHKDDQCAMVVQYVKDATPPSFGGKPGQPPRVNPSAARVYPMTMSAALAANKPLCGLCYPPISIAKPEAKQEKPKEVVSGRNFMEHLMRLKNEEPKEYLKFWTEYLQRLEGPDGPELGRKFQEAFNGKHSYEAFRFVVGLPHRNARGGEEWHHALDALLGRVTPPSSLKKSIEGFIEEEKRQTEEMFRALFAWLEKSNAARKERHAILEAELESLRNGRKERARARKTGKTVRKIVFLVLLVILASGYIMTRVTDAPARSETSEQKVEIPNER